MNMTTVTVSEKGQVVIPVEIRRRLGIVPGCQLEFDQEGKEIRVRIHRQVVPSSTQDGFGMLVCSQPGERRLSEFDVARAMRETEDDRS